MPYRLHGEHGWDVFDPDGSNVKYQWLRRLWGLLIHRFILLSRQLQDYLQDKAGTPAAKISRICNGVDSDIFHPRIEDRRASVSCPLNMDDKVVIGTVGRMHGVKDQMTLARSYLDV